jgi:peptide/nickel transport system permease protein
MRKYILRRVLLFVPTLLGVALVIFILLRILPGDVAVQILAGPNGEAEYTQEDVDSLRERYGLNDPIHIQFVNWIWDFARGDLGQSYATNRPVWGELKRQFPITLQLAVLTAIVVSVIAIPIGIIAAVRQDGWLDFILRTFAIVGLAMPSFFVGLLVILGLSVYIGWLPPVGFTSLWDDPITSIQQLLLPAVALGFSSNGLLLRITRTQLLEVLREDYVRTARAKGLTERVVIMKHAVRNALLPVVTVGGTQIGFLFSGTIVIETLFNLPGLGRGLINALNTRDLPVIQIYIMYFALVALVANLIVDLTYAWLDPRIRYA